MEGSYAFMATESELYMHRYNYSRISTWFSLFLTHLGPAVCIMYLNLDKLPEEVVTQLPVSSF